MASKHISKSMVKETISAGGTGSITLGGAVLGFKTLASVLTDTQVAYVMISLPQKDYTGGANDWEISRVVYTAAGGTLARTVLESSNANAAINVSTAHEIFIVLPSYFTDAVDMLSQDGNEQTTIYGNGAGNNTTIAYDNTVFGGNAGQGLDTGPENTLVGSHAGQNIGATTTLTTMVGKDAGRFNTGNASCGFGKDTLGGSGNIHTGFANNCFGTFAGDTLTSGDANCFFGYNTGTLTTTGRRNSLYGNESEAPTSVNYSYSVGYRNRHNNSTTLLFGYRLTSTATRQCVWGNAAYTNEGDVSDFYLNGITAPFGSSPTLHAVGGSGTDSVGKNLNLASGIATGNAAGGAINFQTSDVGASGTTAQPLTTKMTISPAGIINTPTMPTSSAGLVAGDWWNNAGTLSIV